MGHEIPCVVLIDSLNNSPSIKKEIVQMMFDSFPIILLGIYHQLSCDLISQGATKGIVLNLGEGHC